MSGSSVLPPAENDDDEDSEVPKPSPSPTPSPMATPSPLRWWSFWRKEFWRKETFVPLLVASLVSIGLTYWSVTVSRGGVKMSEGSRMDGLAARLDSLGTRLDAANERNNDLTAQLNKIKQHEKKMWDLANDICRHLVEEEEEARAQGAAGTHKSRPPGYIPGTSLSEPTGSRRFQAQLQLCSAMPPDPGL